jgi:hypothetical protein
MRDPTSKPKLCSHTPRHIFSDEEFAHYRHVFEKAEQDFDQQDANEAISGPGRTTFHPADRTTQPHPIVRHSSGEIQSRYCPYDGELIISACRSAISIHQMMYKIDPLQIRISTIMYFDLSEAKRKMYGIPFTGKISFISLTDSIGYADVRLYSDTSTNIVICVH